MMPRHGSRKFSSTGLIISYTPLDGGAGLKSQDLAHSKFEHICGAEGST